MLDSKPYYFYLWQHRYLDDTDAVKVRTCFGITSNPASRVHGYEGHVGHTVRFARLWSGPERLIRELENRVKSDFHDHVFVGTDGFRYEWICETVAFETVVAWTEWEIANTFSGITDVSAH